jgi:hypothetical protein
MPARFRRLVPLAIAAVLAATPVAAVAKSSSGGPLTGTWTGTIKSTGGTPITPFQIRISVNAKETGGSWWISATCHGPLTLESISYGYHHYTRHLASGSTCAGGDIDCLKRAGANMYDAVTSHLGGAYDIAGTLRRVSG